MPEVRPASNQSPSDVRFAGVRFTPLGMEEAAAALAARPAGAPFAYYVTPNVQHIDLHRADPAFADAYEQALISTNDSRILHRVAKWAGLELKFAAGSHVTRELLEAYIRPGDRLTLVGGTPEMAAALRERYGLRALVQHIPPMGFIHDPKAVREAVDFVAAHPARFVFVAMGPPQSELFCREVRRDGRATGLGLCIGSSIMVLSGAYRAAPQWAEASGLVWLYRLTQEPRRLWRRYLVQNLPTLAFCLAEAAATRLKGRRSAVRG
ncbi:WecB/TagA/CpsF family glycosyltransferase [Phenylobacterium sp. VNQ135]|uniref:WecB/TagA/CpsF family glycosyltransferase n=1 Tax=Phenylobacterium sp. VNQ135 TaxID=3400922 RepID=UPI003C0A75D7